MPGDKVRVAYDILGYRCVVVFQLSGAIRHVIKLSLVSGLIIDEIMIKQRWCVAETNTDIIPRLGLFRSNRDVYLQCRSTGSGSSSLYRGWSNLALRQSLRFRSSRNLRQIILQISQIDPESVQTIRVWSDNEWQLDDRGVVLVLRPGSFQFSRVVHVSGMFLDSTSSCPARPNWLFVFCSMVVILYCWAS